MESINLLASLGIKRWKVPSGEITNLPYLKKIAAFNQPIIISTGMCFMHEITEAVDVLVKYGTHKNNITVLHCNTEYPTPMQDVHLNAMLHIKQQTGLQVGYSDHTNGIEVPIAAVALGATVIEKHFTLDKTMQGPDHKASLNPIELKQMVLAIRNIEQALGNSIKEPSPSEIKNIPIARKSIVAADTIAAGTIFTANNLTTKRPGNGISPMQWESVLGKMATKNFEKDDLIEL
jgi:N,N'-diacetyllegionaminate synthase